MFILIRNQKLLFCHVDTTKSIQATNGGGG